MTPIRQQMIRELELHRKAPRTIESYVCAVAQLAAHYRRSTMLVTLWADTEALFQLATDIPAAMQEKAVTCHRTPKSR